MPTRPETGPGKREARLTAAQRQELIREIIKVRGHVTKPDWAFHPDWEHTEPYTTLIPMIGMIQHNSSLTQQENSHLRKMAAWQADSIDRTKIRSLRGYEEVWRIVDEQLTGEMAAVTDYSLGHTVVPRSWKNAFTDLEKIKKAPLKAEE